MNYAIVGAMLNSALYLTAVFVAGLTTGNRHATLLAILAFGLTYVSYLLFWVVQLRAAAWSLHATVVTWLSILIGALAGLSLLI